MAEQNRSESPAQARPRPTVATNPAVAESPRAPAPADPHANPGQYLLAAGWKPLGPVDHPGTPWLDPTKPLATTESRIPIMADVLKPAAEKGGKPEVVREHLMVQTGQPGKKQPGFQTVIHTAGVPMRMADALQEQMARDYRAAAQQSKG